MRTLKRVLYAAMVVALTAMFPMSASALTLVKGKTMALSAPACTTEKAARRVFEDNVKHKSFVAGLTRFRVSPECDIYRGWMKLIRQVAAYKETYAPDGTKVAQYVIEVKLNGKTLYILSSYPLTAGTAV